MKILFVYPNQFGYFPDIYEYCNILSDLGHTVYYFGIFKQKHLIKARSKVDIHEINPKNLIEFSRSAARYIKIARPDVIHVFHYRGAFLLRLFSPLFEAKWVLDVRTLHVGNNKGEMKFLKFKNKVTHFESLFFNKILTLTEDIKSNLLPNKVRPTIIPLGGNFKLLSKDDEKLKNNYRKKYEINENDIVVIYCGILNRGRKIEFLLEGFNNAIKQNAQDFINIKFMVVGNDSENGNYILDLKKIDKLNRFIFTGYIPYDNIHYYYNLADIGVVFFPPNTPHEKQPPTKLIEYLMSGLISIANNTLPNKKLIPNSEIGIIYDNNLSSLSEAFIKSFKLVKFEDKVTSYKIRAREHSKQYDWSNIVNKHLNKIYEE